MKPALRKTLYSVHLWIGLILGAYFSLLGITGSALVFKDELQKSFHPELYEVASNTTFPPLVVDEVVKKFLQAHPGAQSLSIELPDSANASLKFTYLPLERLATVKKRRDWREAFYNPYTGALLGDQVNNGAFFNWIHELHTRLLLNDAGSKIHSIGVIWLLLLEITGLWLWFPKREFFLKQVRQKMWVNWHAPPKRVLFNTHNVVGFYTFLVLLPIVLTAASHLWPKFTDATLQLFIQKVPSQPDLLFCGQKVEWTYAAEIEAARRAVPNLSVLQIRADNNDSSIMMGTEKDHLIAARLTSVKIDHATYQVTRILSPELKPKLFQIEAWLMLIHFGRWGYGCWFNFIKGIWVIIGLAPSLLFTTGLLVYLGKRKRL